MTSEKFDLILSLKVSALVDLLMEYNSALSKSEAYKKVKNSYTFEVLNDKNSRLYLESTEFLKTVFKIEQEEGKAQASKYLQDNIG
jgi:hypothetical protein